MAKLRAVVFDMDNTLVEWKDPEVRFQEVAQRQFEAVHQILVERGHEPPRTQEFSSALYTRAVSRWREAMRHCQSFTVTSLLAEGLPEMDLQVTADDLKAGVAAFEAILAPTGPKDNVLQTLTALKDRGLKLGLISNSWSTPGCREEELRQAGLLDLLEARVYSSEMEVMKPHPAIFTRALDELGVMPVEALMVGDMLETDVGGAQGVGMRGIWLDHHHRGLPEGTTVQPDAIIRQLGELLDVLDRWQKS